MHASRRTASPTNVYLYRRLDSVLQGALRTAASIQCKAESATVNGVGQASGRCQVEGKLRTFNVCARWSGVHSRNRVILFCCKEVSIFISIVLHARLALYNPSSSFSLLSLHYILSRKLEYVGHLWLRLSVYTRCKRIGVQSAVALLIRCDAQH